MFCISRGRAGVGRALLASRRPKRRPPAAGASAEAIGCGGAWPDDDTTSTPAAAEEEEEEEEESAFAMRAWEGHLRSVQSPLCRPFSRQQTRTRKPLLLFFCLGFSVSSCFFDTLSSDISPLLAAGCFVRAQELNTVCVCFLSALLISLALGTRGSFSLRSLLSGSDSTRCDVSFCSSSALP